MGWAVAALSAVFGLSGCWFGVGFNAHRTGYNPLETTISPATAPNLVEVWAEDDHDGGATEIVRTGAGPIHVLDSRQLRTLDFDTGALLWETLVPGAEVGELSRGRMSAGLADVVVASYDPGRPEPGCLLRYDARTGALLGCVPFRADIEQADERDVVTLHSVRSGDWVAVVIAYRGVVEEPRVLLSVVHLGDPGSSWSVDRAVIGLEAPPLIVGSELLVGTASASPPLAGVLEVWNLHDGCAPTCAPDRVIDVTALNPSWVSASPSGSHLAISGDRLHVVDLATGALRWSGAGVVPPGNGGHAAWAEDVIVSTSGAEPVRAYPASGCGASICEAVWASASPIGWPTGPAAAANGAVFVSALLNELLAFPLDCATPCSPVFTSQDPLGFGAAIITGGRVVAGYLDGGVRSLAPG
jgi:hypothetical protein